MKQQDFPPLGTPAPTKSIWRSARIAAPAVPPAQPKQSPFSTLLKQVMAAKTQQSQILAEIRPFINAMIEKFRQYWHKLIASVLNNFSRDFRETCSAWDVHIID